MNSNVFDDFNLTIPLSHRCFRTGTKVAFNNGICLLISQTRTKEDDDYNFGITNKYFNHDFKFRNQNRAIMEALKAKRFACVPPLKLLIQSFNWLIAHTTTKLFKLRTNLNPTRFIQF